MGVKLLYGRDYIDTNIPEENVYKVLKRKQTPTIPIVTQYLTQCLENPVGTRSFYEIVRNKKDICIVITDHTRPTPNHIILPPVLLEIEKCGIPKECITILIASGAHEPTIGKALEELVGKYIVENYTIISHNANNIEESQYIGTTPSGTRAYVNKRYLDSDCKILIGLIEPHRMAGFSGGRKLICPGISYIETIGKTHGEIYNPEECFPGITKNNPFHNELLTVAKMAGCDFLLNVIINEKREIIYAVSGEMEQSYAEGIDFFMTYGADTVNEEVDIVITSAGGYPLDQWFSQSVKGLEGALGIVKKGGTIIIASSCEQGMGDFTSIPPKVLNKAQVIYYANEFMRPILEKHDITVTDTIECALNECLLKYGKNAKVAIIPEGPLMLAKIV